MAAFNDALAGRALSRLSRKRAASAEVAMPADVCLFAWLAAEAARQGVNPIQISISQIHKGFKDELGTVDRVGLALNTIHLGMERLEDGGFIATQAIKSLAGGGKLMEITIT